MSNSLKCKSIWQQDVFMLMCFSSQMPSDLNFPSRHINHCSNAINKLPNEEQEEKARKSFPFKLQFRQNEE